VGNCHCAGNRPHRRHANIICPRSVKTAQAYSSLPRNGERSYRASCWEPPGASSMREQGCSRACRLLPGASAHWENSFNACPARRPEAENARLHVQNPRKGPDRAGAGEVAREVLRLRRLGARARRVRVRRKDAFCLAAQVRYMIIEMRAYIYRR